MIQGRTVLRVFTRNDKWTVPAGHDRNQPQRRTWREKSKVVITLQAFKL